MGVTIRHFHSHCRFCQINFKNKGLTKSDWKVKHFALLKIILLPLKQYFSFHFYIEVLQKIQFQI